MRSTGSLQVCACVCVLSRKQDQYRFCWYLPLAGLKLHWASDEEHPPPANLRLCTLKNKMYTLRHQLQQQAVGWCGETTHLEMFFFVTTDLCLCVCKGTRAISFTARNQKKLEQMELMMFILSALYRLELHSPSGKVRTHTKPNMF